MQNWLQKQKHKKTESEIFLEVSDFFAEKKIVHAKNDIL